ncbi:MAG: SAM-dependent methyltransferase [Pseudomonadota bacterium]
MSLKRVDQILSSFFPDLSRSKIQSLIERKKIQFMNEVGDWVSFHKPGEKRDPSQFKAEGLRILADPELDFVSRGALKLKGAFDHWPHISAQGKTCLDIGLSTGGFSDFLLQNGASRVLGIDAGSGQLHSKLKDHPKLDWYDKINARNSIPQTILDSFFGGHEPVFDCIVVDVSFISLSHFARPIRSLLAPSGFCVALFKPQFEVGRGFLNKKGVVVDSQKVAQTLAGIQLVFNDNDLNVLETVPSPIEGENGNQEILLLIRHP